MDIKNCLGKKIVYGTKDYPYLEEGVVESIQNSVVKINGSWWNIADVNIKAVLPDGTSNESYDSKDQVIEG